MSGIGMLSRLEPSACAFEQRVDGGWVAEVSMENLAGALGHMSADQSAIVRVIVLNDPRAYRYALSRVRGMLLTGLLALDEQQTLAEIILKSVVTPEICPTCEGRSHTGHTKEMALMMTCPGCMGTGRRAHRGSDNPAWKHIFQAEYERCRAVLGGWIGEAGRIWRAEMEDNY